MPASYGEERAMAQLRRAQHRCLIVSSCGRGFCSKQQSTWLSSSWTSCIPQFFSNVGQCTTAPSQTWPIMLVLQASPAEVQRGFAVNE